MNRRIVAVWAAVVLAVASAEGWTATWFVDGKTCPSVGSGTSSSPYCDIQLAIDLAQPGDVVKVAAGTYTAKQTRPINNTVPVFPNPATAVVFMKDQVHLEGSGAGKSILNAGGADRVVIFDSVGLGTRFQGFTVTGGDTTARVGDGGGLLILLSSPTITQNLITGNHAIFGGGIEVIYSAPVIQDNVISANTGGNTIESSTGGGIDLAFDSSPVITRNVIVGNYVNGSGGGVAFYQTYGQLDSNYIVGNVAEVNGGGVWSVPTANGTRDTASLRSNVISLNVVRTGHGGGAFISEGTDLLTNTVSHNRAVAGDGGGAFVLGGSINLRDNILYRNGAVAGGGAYFDPTSNSVQVIGNDAYGNLPTDYAGSQNPAGTQGNWGAEPLLLNVPDFVADVQIDRFHNLVTELDSEPTRQFVLGDVVEYGDDGVRRTVTEIKTAVGVPLIKLVVSPILSEAEAILYPVVLRRWGANSNLKEDFGIQLTSPAVDQAGGNSNPAQDVKGHVRDFDGDLNGVPKVDVGAIESLAEMPRLGIAADGGLTWQPYAGRPWHYHLYRGFVSGLVDSNKDGVPDGPDRTPGTPDDGYGSCLAPGVPLPGPDYADPQIPAPGQVFYYLCTVMGNTEGILGYSSAGQQRTRLVPCD